MAHRHADYVDFCFQCEERASDTCFRCERHLCQKHKPDLKKRCSICESKYAQDLEIQLSRVNRPTFEATQLLRWTWSFFKGSAMLSLVCLGLSVVVPFFLSLFFFDRYFFIYIGSSLKLKPPLLRLG